MIEKLDRDSLMEKITAEPYLAPEVLMGIFMYLGNQKNTDLFKTLMESGTTLAKFYTLNFGHFFRRPKTFSRLGRGCIIRSPPKSKLFKGKSYSYK